jgi:hypothetical protein
MRTVVGALMLVILAACGGGPEPDPSCTQPEPTSSVELADFDFAPVCIGAASGATISLDNTGVAPHTFTVEGTDVDVNVPAGSVGEADLSGIDSGAYAVTCTYHPQITATLRVA